MGHHYNNKKMKDEDRSPIVKNKSRPPPEVPPGTKEDRSAKNDAQGENISIKTEQDMSNFTVVMSKKKCSKVARKKTASSGLQQRDRATKIEYRPVKYVEEEETTKSWQLDLRTEQSDWKTLKTLFSGDPVLQILMPKLIGRFKSREHPQRQHQTRWN